MKKKLAIVLCVLLLACVPMFAATEHWLGLGGEYGFSSTANKNTDSTLTHSAGFDLMSYNFFSAKGAFGLYANMAFLFPIKQSTGNITVDSKLPMLFNVIVGPAYRYAIDKNMTFSAAAGLNLGVQGRSDTNAGLTVKGTSMTLGVGIDAGVQVVIDNRFFVRAGSKIGLDFGCYNKLSASAGGVGGSSGSWVDGYFRFSATPYIGGGVYLNSGKKAGIGRL